MGNSIILDISKVVVEKSDDFVRIDDNDGSIYYVRIWNVKAIIPYKSSGSRQGYDRVKSKLELFTGETIFLELLPDEIASILDISDA